MKNSRLRDKIDNYFDLLESHMEAHRWEEADIVLSKLSIYFHLFDDELVDFYQYANEKVDYELNHE